jgi:hypothetical protein
VRCATDLRHRRFLRLSKRAFCHARRALPVTNHRSEPTSGRHTFLGASKIDPTASVAPRRRRPPISHHRNGTSNHRAHRAAARSLRHDRDDQRAGDNVAACDTRQQRVPAPKCLPDAPGLSPQQTPPLPLAQWLRQRDPTSTSVSRMTTSSRDDDLR